MRIENVSLPYPVLGISDDIKPTLLESDCDTPDIRVDEDGEYFRITVALRLKNEDILSYIKNEFAEYSVEVSCYSTMFRKCVSSPTPEFSFSVEKKKLNGKLDFESFVIAKKDILNYKNKGLNPDYDGRVINLHKGDLLVAYNKCWHPLNLDLRNIRNMKSFMTVQKNNNENEHSVVYELDTSNIIILLPAEMMTEFNKKPSMESNNPENNRRKAVLKASLYLQALTYALLNFQDYKDTDKMWVNALKYRMNEPDIRELCVDIFNEETNSPDSQNIDELFKLAHIMLNQPYLGMLKLISTGGNNVGPIYTEG